MPFAATCNWTLGRSLLVVLLAWPVCWGVERTVRASRRSSALMLLIAAPFLLPELLVGYLLSPLVAGFPWRSEAACAAVLLLRSVPVGVMALRGTPSSPVSPVALHVRRMSCRRWQDGVHLLQCYFYGPIRRALPSLGLMFLIAFQEFEAAALVGSISWTDRLFTEHATGLSLGASWVFLARPLVMQSIVLLGILWSLCGLSDESDRNSLSIEVPLPSRRIVWCSWTYALLAAAIGVVLPLVLLTSQLNEGWRWLWSQPLAWKKLGTEICTAGLLGLVAGLGTWHLACSLLSHRCPRWLTAVSTLPGLCGGLTVSLAVLWLSIAPLFRALTGTPVFWVIALMLWLLPRAVLLQLWLSRQTDPAAMHLIRLLQQSPAEPQRRSAERWRWRWQIEPQIAACGILCYWAYLDLTAAALLAPPGMASIMVRLYNFMHFGRSAAMTIEAAVAMFAPLIVAGVLIAVARFFRWKSWP